MPEERSYPEVRDAVTRLCKDFPDEYWREKDRIKAYPSEFVQALTDAGYLSVLIPEEYDGAGMDLAAACAVLEEIQRSGANGGACHAQMYTMGTLLRHGNAAQKQKYLPQIASGELRLQAFGVTEPTSGTDTTRIKTNAVRDGDHYVVTGQKVFISRAEHSDLMLLLVRTTPRDEVDKRTQGMSVLLVDLREAVGNGLTIRPLETMMNHATTELFFDKLRVPAENLIGEEGKGFRYILDGMNAERILIAAECIGDARWFIEHASQLCTRARSVRSAHRQEPGYPVSDRARARADRSRRADGRQGCRMFDADEACGSEANMAKLLAADASWAAADMCLQTHGGYGFTDEYDVERKFRETRLYQVAPISTNLILSNIATHVLGLPKSF